MLISKTPFNKSLVFFYNNMSPKRNFSIEQVKDIYNKDYINFNLKNILTHPEGFPYKWIAIKDLKLDVLTINMEWRTAHDPFANKCQSSLEFAKELINEGTYFPIIVTNEKNGYVVWEGQHRIQALKIATAYNLISENYQLLCIVISPGLIAAQKLNKSIKKNSTSIKGRFIIEQKYNPEYLTNKNYHQQVVDYFNKSKFKIINSYTVEEETVDRIEMYNYLTYYPLFLRDLFYHYRHQITPHPIINNKEEFLKWINI